MRNNFTKDKYFQGYGSPAFTSASQAAAAHMFSLYHWNLVDVFIYFSNHLITIPPE